MDLYPSGRPPHEDKNAKPSFVRRNWRRTKFIARGPVESIGINDISNGARLIDQLLSVVRSGPEADHRLKTHGRRQIDLAATAFSYGITIDALVDRLQFRQRQTARAAYATFCLGTLSLILWLYAALHMVQRSARVFSLIEFLPFCALFFLLSFKSALLNWQIRTQQLGSAAAFLRTTEPFLPRG